ncbi:uncharacterized protein GLRG_11331 [Colletotrichum graminicola M1.001]|uniref:Uncharacterized protein n=1 Tax=Colletotrichum graminicola (strain M1.001 / M2 / FGSC 10212) TaxID=645133 RepID=E3QZ79_COLGM|nr:uncharacterized protein GLRG_11331 [Colletotrichum graminicola M1.001]EFQ36167.1 hypothetical protein GLRG_11331 [Colletotrichum graminicola M1.001]
MWGWPGSRVGGLWYTPLVSSSPVTANLSNTTLIYALLYGYYSSLKVSSLWEELKKADGALRKNLLQVDKLAAVQLLREFFCRTADGKFLSYLIIRYANTYTNLLGRDLDICYLNLVLNLPGLLQAVYDAKAADKPILTLATELSKAISLGSKVPAPRAYLYAFTKLNRSLKIKTKILISTYNLASTGLDDLKVANYLVYYSVNKHATKVSQASGRINRQGQPLTCFI